MTVSPVQWNDAGIPTLYQSSPVYTSYAGQQILVCTGYTAGTPEEIMRLAFGNASIRQQIAGLGDRMRMPTESLPRAVAEGYCFRCDGDDIRKPCSCVSCDCEFSVPAVGSRILTT